MAPFTILNETDPKYQQAQALVDPSFKILKISEINNQRLMKGFERRKHLLMKFSGVTNERLMFHGSPSFSKIVDTGFKENLSVISNNSPYFGQGIYFSDTSLTSDGYIGACPRHNV